MSKDLIPKVTLAIPRRTFLHRSAVILGGALVAGPAFAAKRDCRPTESEILGPFIDSARHFEPGWRVQTSLVTGLF